MTDHGYKHAELLIRCVQMQDCLASVFNAWYHETKDPVVRQFLNNAVVAYRGSYNAFCSRMKSLDVKVPLFDEKLPFYKKLTPVLSPDLSDGEKIDYLLGMGDDCVYEIRGGAEHIEDVDVREAVSIFADGLKFTEGVLRNLKGDMTMGGMRTYASPITRRAGHSDNSGDCPDGDVVIGAF